jgi:hypothetical protein
VSDLKMTCPGCGSRTSSVGLAYRDAEACPHCELPFEDAAAEFRADRARSLDMDAIIDRVLVERAYSISDGAVAIVAAEVGRQLVAAIDAASTCGDWTFGIEAAMELIREMTEES